jgi:hypothetical protein
MLTYQRLDLYLSSPLCAVSWPVSNVSSIFLSASELTIQLAYLERSWSDGAEESHLSRDLKS